MYAPHTRTFDPAPPYDTIPDGQAYTRTGRQGCAHSPFSALQQKPASFHRHEPFTSTSFELLPTAEQRLAETTGTPFCDIPFQPADAQLLRPTSARGVVAQSVQQLRLRSRPSMLHHQVGRAEPSARRCTAARCMMPAVTSPSLSPVATASPRVTTL